MLKDQERWFSVYDRAVTRPATQAMTRRCKRVYVAWLVFRLALVLPTTYVKHPFSANNKEHANQKGRTSYMRNLRTNCLAFALNCHRLTPFTDMMSCFPFSGYLSRTGVRDFLPKISTDSCWETWDLLIRFSPFCSFLLNMLSSFWLKCFQ
jgi:hypothetical protein